MTENTQPTELELDEFTHAYIVECSMEVNKLTSQMNTALQLFIRRNGLQGQWRLDERTGASITRIDVPAAEPELNLTQKNGRRK